MSVSSGSDVTIRVQDSPPPPPSPYGNRIEQEGKHGDIGLDNVAFEPDSNENEKKNNQHNNKAPMDSNNKGKGGHTKVTMNGQEPPLLNEALNSELINLNIMNTIPDKPQPEFGPYENPDEYFIAVNQHKKFLRRSEKLYVTKDKRKGNPWKKYVCWFLGAFILATIVTVAVLAGLGLISQKTTSAFTESVLGTTSSSGLSSSSLNPVSTTTITSASSDHSDHSTDDWISASASTTSTARSTVDEFDFSSSPSSAARPPLSDNYVHAAADVTLTLSNAEYTAALNNKSSDKFHELATEIEQEVKNVLRNQAGMTTAHAKVMEFLPGSILIKMRLSWLGEDKELMDVQMFMSSLRHLGNYEIPPGATKIFGLVNHCKFGNYGCSNECTFDYEQLDFLCTCPESLLLSEDKKQCVENETLSSSTTETENVPETPQIVISSEKTDHHPEIFTEPPIVVASTTENLEHHHHHEHEHTPSPQIPLTTEAPIHEAEISPAVSVIPDASHPEDRVNETSFADVTTSHHGVNESTIEGEGHSGHVSPLPPVVVVATTQLPDDTDVETINNEQQNTSRLPENEDEDQTKSPLVSSQETDSDRPTEDPLSDTTSSLSSFNPNVTVVSDEEGSNSNDALLQRTETDNYSEVEQHQRIVATITTTTTGTPIISFNSSRYSEENNASTLLSQESSSVSEESPIVEDQAQVGNVEKVLVGNSSSSEGDAELISSDLVQGNNTRSKSARFESFGEDQQTVPLFHRSQFINATARRVLTNSAEFMVYGDNILGETPNQSNQGGTDSGLTDHESFPHHQTTLGRFNLDSNETETTEGGNNNNNNSREGNATESEVNHNSSSGSVEVVSNESLTGSNGSSPKEDESASLDSEEGPGIVFSGIGQKISERPRDRETEEYTTTVPINLENDTLVNENATTEEESNVEPIVLEDETMATTPGAPKIEETVVVVQHQGEGGAPESTVTEIPKNFVEEEDVRTLHQNQTSFSSSNSSNSDTIPTTQSPTLHMIEIEVTEPSVSDDNVEGETTMAPAIINDDTVVISPVNEGKIVPQSDGTVEIVSNANTRDGTTNSTTTTTISHISNHNNNETSSSSNNHLTTTIKPSSSSGNVVSLNSTNQTPPADNENELS